MSTTLDTLRSRLAKKTRAGREQIRKDNGADNREDGDLSPAAQEAGERMAKDIQPIVEQIARGLNRERFDTEYSRYPDTNFYLSKSYWNQGGSVGEIMRTPSTDPWLKDIQALSDEVVMLARMASVDKKHKNHSYEDVVKGLKHYKRLQESLRPFNEKALATTNAGSGSEWIPTEYSADLVDEVRLNTLVAGLFRVIPFSEGNSLVLPTSTSRPTAYIADEADSDDPTQLQSSDLGSGRVTLTPKTFAVRVNLSYEFIEDSIVPALPLVREKIVLGLADGIENAVINGDTSSAHMDTGLQATFDATPSDVRVAAFDGLRKLTISSAQVDADTGTEAFTTANHRAVRKAMGRYGVRPDEGAWVSSINGYIRMLSLAEVITLDKLGSQATILSGQLASFDGSPIVVSEFVRNDLNTSGVFDNTTKTQSLTLYVHRPSFVFAEKRAVTVEMETQPSRQRHIMIATLRRDFKSARPSTDSPVGYLYDYAS